MPRITLQLSYDVWQTITRLAQAELDKIDQELRELEAPVYEKPPISKAEWMRTPEGREFTRDCIANKYLHLDTKGLAKLTEYLYLKTFGIVDSNNNATRKARRPRPTLAELQRKIVEDVISHKFSNLPKE